MHEFPFQSSLRELLVFGGTPEVGVSACWVRPDYKHCSPLMGEGDTFTGGLRFKERERAVRPAREREITPPGAKQHRLPSSMDQEPKQGMGIQEDGVK